MTNTFYGAFDTENWGPPRRGDYRSAFQIDRDRIIHSAAFRRLQSKTQVFVSGEYDFYRTRLTHSLEVAQIGRSICHYLRTREGTPLRPDFHIDADLVEAVCLAHDLGHPPFGHAGERRLHERMRGHGGFEGNAQTLRLLTETLWQSESTGGEGMAPTRAFLDGVLKYKTLLAETPDAGRHFLYDAQACYRAFAFGDENPPAALTPGRALNAFRSIECQIMDWADDTAYSLHDISDGVRAGFLTLDRIERWATAQREAGGSTGPDIDRWIQTIAEAVRADGLERMVGRKIGACVRATRLVPAAGFLAARTHRHAFALEIDADVAREIRFYKRLALDLVFRSPPLEQAEHNGCATLDALFTAYVTHHVVGGAGSLGLLPMMVARAIADEPTEAGRMRLVCDHVASLTDGQARRAWKRLFDPSFASIVDLG